MDYFEQAVPDGMAKNGLLELGEKMLNQWRCCDWQAALPQQAETFYGLQPSHHLLERTCWHVAQHTRQLMELISRHGISPDGPLTPEDLEGLPLPGTILDELNG